MSVKTRKMEKSKAEALRLPISKGIRAILKDYRHAPRKVRLVADLIRGKRALEALSTLSFLPKKAALPLKKLLESALANAKQQGKDDGGRFVISDVRVDKATTSTRMMPRARGRATPIRKHSSHIVLVLNEQANDASKIAKSKSEV